MANSPTTPAQSKARWSLTSLAANTAGTGVVIVAVGVLMARPDLVVIGIPLVLSLVWSVSSRPTSIPGVGLGEPQGVPSAPDIEALLRIEPAEGVPSARLRLSAETFRPVEALVDIRRERNLRLLLATRRTGRRSVFRVDVAFVGKDTAFRSAPFHVGPRSIILLPQAAALNEVPLPFQLHGLTGAHVSRRVGDGGDFRDIAIFQPGDRLRRIDWKTTAKRGMTGGVGTDLYVRRTNATADAHVMLVLDPRDNVGPDVSTWANGDVNPMDVTSLDIARTAAATLARHYLGKGDRVGLVDLGRDRRPLLPASGRRHLHRIVHHLAAAEPDGEPRRYVRAPQIPSGVLVVVFSTFLDQSYADMARLWRHDGHRVLGVDVLPPLVTSSLSQHTNMALRLLWMERQDRLAELRLSGVEVIGWAGASDDAGPVASLAVLSRALRTPR